MPILAVGGVVPTSERRSSLRKAVSYVDGDACKRASFLCRRPSLPLFSPRPRRCATFAARTCARARCRALRPGTRAACGRARADVSDLYAALLRPRGATCSMRGGPLQRVEESAYLRNGSAAARLGQRAGPLRPDAPSRHGGRRAEALRTLLGTLRT